MESPKNLLEVALEAAKASGRYLAEGFGRSVDVKFKGDTDLVTQYDLGSEEIIRKILNRNYPGHSILGEEGGLQPSKSAYRWYIDPLDGTTNFSRSHAFFAVSIACCLMIPGRPPRPLAAVVEAPVLRETYWAYEGGGAWLSQDIPGRGPIEDRVKSTQVTNPLQALVCTGFPYDVSKRTAKVVEPLTKILPKVQAVRRAGAAALDMAYVAAGRAEGYFEFGPKAWDLAAGILLVTESGGLVSDITGGAYVLEKSESIIAAGSAFHPILVSLIN